MTKKLTLNEHRDVMTLFKYKVSVGDIAERFKVSRETIYRIIKDDVKYKAVLEEKRAVNKVKFYDRIHSKYGFGEVEVGGSIVVDGDFSKIRCASYRFKEKWGAYFYVRPMSEGKVKIERYK